MDDFLKNFTDTIFQTFDDDAKRKSPHLVKVTHDFNPTWFQELNKAGAGIFFTPQRYPGQRRKDLCQGINAWYVDIDEKDGADIQTQKELILASPLPPSFVVRTKNGYHVYWLSTGDATQENFSRIEKGLIERFHGDSSCNDIARVLRVPDFYHMKDSTKPFRIRLVVSKPERKYTEDQMLDSFPFTPEIQTEIQTSIVLPDNGTFWGTLARIPNKLALQRLSGSHWVQGEVITFDRRTPGEKIIVNGKEADAWLDAQGMIGSGRGKRGGPTWIQWLEFYQWRKRDIAQCAKDIFRDLLPIEISMYQKNKPENSIPEEEPIISGYTMSQVVEMGIEELLGTTADDIISYGYDWLDDKLTGIFKGELIIVGGESGTGKTAFVTNIAYKTSQTKKVAIFALEDRLPEYGMKALYFKIGNLRKQENLKNYRWNDYRKNQIIDPNFKDYIDRARQELANEKLLFITATHRMDIDLLEQAMEQELAEGVQLFVIDHLHYFDLLRGNNSKADYIESIMIRLREFQKRTGARIIMVVHYRKTNGQKPTLDSFKDSISIVQNANYVINLWRDRSESAQITKTLFMIPKARNPNGEATIEAEWDRERNDYRSTGNWIEGTYQEQQEYRPTIKQDKIF